MAINKIEYSKKFQTSLDKQMLVGATSGWMEDNAKDIQYDGGDEVKIPSIIMQGLANYDRDNGFIRGSVTLKYQTVKMTQDRGRTFSLDSVDVNESNFIAKSGNVMGEFQRTQVIPEIDSYRHSKIFALLKAKTRVTEGYDPDESTIFGKLEDDIAKIEDVVGTDVELVIIMSSITRKILSDSLKASRKLDIADFKRGSVFTKVKTYDEKPLIIVPSARLKTVYKINDGKTAGQEEGGIVADTTAKDINWIITPRTAPIAVSKQDKVRIFTPDENQDADAWKLDYRRYHDLWIPDNKLTAMWANTK
jgi:lj928 prophage protein